MRTLLFVFALLIAAVAATHSFPPYVLGQTSFTVTRPGVPGVFPGDSADSKTYWGVPLPRAYANESLTTRKLTVTVSYPADPSCFDTTTASLRPLMGIPANLLQQYAPRVPLGYDNVPSIHPDDSGDAAVEALGVYAIVVQDTGQEDDTTEYVSLPYAAGQMGAVTISIDWHPMDSAATLGNAGNVHGAAWSNFVYYRTGDVLAVYEYVLSVATNHPNSPLYGIINASSPVGLIGHSFAGVSALLNTAGLKNGHGLNGFDNLTWSAQNVFKGVILLEPSDWYFKMSSLNHTAANNVSVLWFSSQQNQAEAGERCFNEIYQSQGRKNKAFGFSIAGTGHDFFAASNCLMKGFYKNVNNTMINGQLYVAYPVYDTFHEWYNAGEPFSNFVYFDQCDNSYNDTIPQNVVLNLLIKYIQAFTRYVLIGDNSYAHQFDACEVAASTPANVTLKYWSTNARQAASQLWDPPASMIANLQGCCGINFAAGGCALDEYLATWNTTHPPNADDGDFYYLQNPNFCH
jgi:hypothetical protein